MEKKTETTFLGKDNNSGEKVGKENVLEKKKKNRKRGQNLWEKKKDNFDFFGILSIFIFLSSSTSACWQQMRKLFQNFIAFPQGEL